MKLNINDNMEMYNLSKSCIRLSSLHYNCTSMHRSIQLVAADVFVSLLLSSENFNGTFIVCHAVIFLSIDINCSLLTCTSCFNVWFRYILRLGDVWSALENVCSKSRYPWYTDWYTESHSQIEISVIPSNLLLCWYIA